MAATEEHGPFCAGCLTLENIALKAKVERLQAKRPILPPLPPRRPCEHCGGVEHTEMGLIVHASQLCPGVDSDLLMLGSALVGREE